jgi:hypothetical protein
VGSSSSSSRVAAVVVGSRPMGLRTNPSSSSSSSQLVRLPSVYGSLSQYKEGRRSPVVWVSRGRPHHSCGPRRMGPSHLSRSSTSLPSYLHPLGHRGSKHLT